MLQIGLHGGSRLSSLTVNMNRICDVLSGGLDSPSCVHHPHSFVTPVHDSLGVGCAYWVTAAREGKRKENDDLDARMRTGADDVALVRKYL